jgi:hypothetical protein|tara:strand:- start:1453 stop:1758 length:306 start_codon:yes stop_codon:yes gene_type:complete
MGNSKTSKHYKDNPESAEQHRKYQREYNKTPEAIKSRGEDNQARADLNIPVGSKMDASRKTRIDKNGKLISYWAKEHFSTNRGSTSNMPGDKRARGGKNKK